MSSLPEPPHWPLGYVPISPRLQTLLVPWLSAYLTTTSPRPSCLGQRLRGRPHPLQGWQCDLSPLEDEAPRERPPTAPLLKPFTFHNHISHQAYSHRMVWCPFFGMRCCLPGTRVPSLTGFQAALALQALAHFFHLGPFPVQRADLCSGSGQPMGGVVLAAVSHHQDLPPPGRDPTAGQEGCCLSHRTAQSAKTRFFFRGQTKYPPESRRRFRSCFDGYQASNRTQAGLQWSRVRA
jgi:hypothetical protein